MAAVSEAPKPEPPANLLLVDLPDGAPAPSPRAAVNPFAVTAAPAKHPGSEPAEPRIAAKVESQPPPGNVLGAPVSPRAVSPLAMSNGISGRTPFQEAVEKARQSVAPNAPGSPLAADAPKKAPKKPGTYVMASAPLRPGQKPGSEPPPAAAEKEAAPAPKKPVAKTVAMNQPPRSQQPPPPSQAQPAPSVRPQSVPGPFPSQPQPLPPPSPWVQSSAPAPSQQHGYEPHRAAQPLAPYPPAPAPHHPAPQWGQAPVGHVYGGYVPGYAPGARVQVTWSNGQRYPATVTQVNGQQHLVRFPDGQQHWVDMQYLSPG